MTTEKLSYEAREGNVPATASTLASLLDEDRREKAAFMGTLLTVLKAIDGNVAAVDYHTYPNNTERVVVRYDNGYQKCVNVTGDSLKALAIDVLEAL